MRTQETAGTQRCLPSVVFDARTLSLSLGPSFVLLIGSAVSGRNFPYVPMALEIMEGILRRAARALERGSYGDRLLAQYALSLSGGPLLPVLRTTKFEEFLYQIDFAAGRDSLDELLASVYVCHKGEYGPNQSAISWLLERRVCSACLTTNFDNSIELASPALIVFNHPNWPKSLPGPKDSPVLLKLHGDAQARNCVATSRAMLNEKRLASHRILRELLAGQTVLVLGYSGTGDVDISPHLGSAGATFLWGVQGKKSPVPPFVKCRVVCDLSTTEPETNLVLRLAELYGWQKERAAQNHEWEQALDYWCRALDGKTLAQIVILTLFGQTGWPLVHASRFAPVRIVSDHPLISEGVACLQVGAYGPAETVFRRALSSGDLSRSQKITAMVYLGFTQRRHGDLERALDTLWWLFDTSFEPHTEEEYVEIGNGLRMYLEAARDWMQLRPSLGKRRTFYQNRRLDDAINRLKELPTIDLMRDILAQTVILHIYHLMGKPVDVMEVKSLFDESFNTMIWGTAEAVGRLLVSVSFWQGLAALAKVDRQLARRGGWNTVRKSVAALMHSAFGGRFPIFLNVLDGPVFGKLVTRWRDWRYKRNLELWNDQWRRGVADVV